MEEIVKMVKDYRKSGLSIDEYCEKNGLSEEEKNIIIMFDSRIKKEIEEKEGGRSR